MARAAPGAGRLATRAARGRPGPAECCCACGRQARLHPHPIPAYVVLEAHLPMQVGGVGGGVGQHIGAHQSIGGGRPPARAGRRSGCLADVPPKALVQHAMTPWHNLQQQQPPRAPNVTGPPLPTPTISDSAPPAAAGGGAGVAHALRRHARRLVVVHPQGRGGVGDEWEHAVAGLSGHLLQGGRDVRSASSAAQGGTLPALAQQTCTAACSAAGGQKNADHKRYHRVQRLIRRPPQAAQQRHTASRPRACSGGAPSPCHGAPAPP